VKQALILLAVVAATAAITYLAVTNHYTAERARRLAQEVAEANGRIAQLEDDLRQARWQLKQLSAAKPTPSIETEVTAVQARARRTQIEPLAPAEMPRPEPVTFRTSTEPLPMAILPVVVWPQSSNWTKYAPMPGGSRCIVAGTSSLHDWTMETPVIGGMISVDPHYDFHQRAAIHTLRGTNLPCQAEVFIPVRSLKSYVNRMDEVMQESMEMADYPRIAFGLSELVFRGSATNALLFDTRGQLIIHGVTNLLKMPVAIIPLDRGQVRVSGAARLKMTDFGVQPPHPNLPGLAAIQTGDGVTISFSWLLEQKR
jgi:outer membrane murein-binding lipoprotein Lpp